MVKFNLGSSKFWNLESSKFWGFVALILFILGLFLAPQIEKDWPHKVSEFMARNWLTLLSILVMLALSFLIIKLSRDVRSLRRKLTSEGEPKFKRFEQIKEVRYGHIAYRPLLYYDTTEEPAGVGITLLE